MPKDVPVLFASLENAAHLGTFFIVKGGKQASAALDFLDWKVRGDQSKRSLFCPPVSNSTSSAGGQVQKPPSASPLEAEGWDITSKNGMC
jgi:hypothetical protein